MFAYTGLKPEQMEVLAKEVSTHGIAKLIQLTDMTLALRLCHQGRSYLGRRYHLGQRQETGRGHLQGHRLKVELGDPSM
jgi:hypothetical protein